MAIVYREMTEADWDGVIEVARKIWFEDLGLATHEIQTLAATIDIRLILKETTHGVLAVDEGDGTIVGVIGFRGPEPLAKRVQGWHEVAIAKALDAGTSIDDETAAHFKQFEQEMRHYLSYSKEMRGDGYDSEITLLILDPDYQGQGIGRGLMERALTWLRSAGSTRLCLDTDDTLNWKFYEHMGWKRALEFPSNVEIFGKQYNQTGYIYEYRL